MPKAYSYLRFSTPEQSKGDSHRRQTDLARAYAAQHGLELDDRLTFHDLGVSAFRGANAETGRLADFLDAVRKGLVERDAWLLVESLDRISRQSARRALRTLEAICDEGITVVTLADGRAYTAESLDGDPTSLLMSILIFIRAGEESQTKSRRLVAAWEQKRKKASDKPMSSVCPAWLRLDKDSGTFLVIEERAEIVRRIYSRFLEGYAPHRIAIELNEEGHPTWGGAAHWDRSYVHKILDSEAVEGTFTPSRIFYGPKPGAQTERERTVRRRLEPLDPIRDYFPRIVDPDTVARVRAIQSNTGAKARPFDGEVRNILAGVGRCPHCGSALLRINRGGDPKYGSALWCRGAKLRKGCDHKAVRYEPLEASVVGACEEILAGAPAGDGDVDRRIEEADNNLLGLSEVAENLAETLAGGYSPTIANKLREVEVALDEVRRERAVLVRERDAFAGRVVKHNLVELGQALRTDPLDRAKVNALFRGLLSEVVVEHELGQLRLVWRHGGESRIQYAMPGETFTRTYKNRRAPRFRKETPQ